jgi:hypothetical protein
MAQTNYTPISLYYSATASNVPTAANLVPGELAINTADGKLYYEDSNGVVQVLATKSTGSIGGSNTQVQFNNSGSLGGSSSFTWDGTTVTATKFAGALNGTVGATTASTGAFTTLTSNGATTFTAGTASTSTTTGTTVITGGLGVSGRINAANFDGIVGANTAAAGSFTNLAYTGTLTGGTGIVNLGSGQIVKTTAGKFGIGYASPQGILHVQGATTQLLLGYLDGDNTYLDSNVTIFRRYALGAYPESMRIDTNGNVGIGTSSPNRLLTVQATGTGNVANFQSNSGPNIAFTGTETSGRTYLIGEGLVTAGNFSIYDSTGSAERFVVNSSGNVIIGTTSSPFPKLYVSDGTVGIGLGPYATGSVAYAGTWTNHALAFVTNGAEAGRFDTSGNLLVGTTSSISSSLISAVSGNSVITVKETTATTPSIYNWNATTTGDAQFMTFATETSATNRGLINYNRTTGLVQYGTTSDYRAKDIISSVTNSGEVIDSVPVYIGKMKGATQERPMFIAHETPLYAHVGKKDAVDADGNPIYQQIDTSSLVPIMWAEIQSLRQRITTLENK